MQIEALKQYVGQVVVLDLIMGKELTTRVTAVDEAKRTVTCSKPRMFVPVPDPQNPTHTNIMAFKYGYPLYEADETLEIDAAHIFTVFQPSPEHQEAYAAKTSSLVTAPAGSLDRLPTLDELGKFKAR